MRKDTESDRRYRSDGVKVAIISGIFVLLGILVRDSTPWYATAFFGVCLVGGIVMALGYRPKERPAEHLSIDDAGVTRSARKLREHVTWDDLVRVCIMTNDQGPQLEDVYFILEGRSGAGCVVAHDLAVEGQLLEALQSRLEGINNAAIIDAMTSIDNKVFTIWEAPDRISS